MPNFTDLTGLVSVASALAASLLLLPGSKRIADSRRAILTGTVFVITLIPFGSIPLAAYVRGATGDLSITTMVLLWCALLRPLLKTSPGCEVPVSGNRIVLLVLIALSAVMLYPMALGFGAIDPYRVGYGDPLFVAALLLVVLAAWFRNYYLVILCIALAALAWAVGWYESSNLWDYLIDPFVSIYALAAIVIQAGKLVISALRENNRQS